MGFPSSLKTEAHSPLCMRPDQALTMSTCRRATCAPPPYPACHRTLTNGPTEKKVNCHMSTKSLLRQLRRGSCLFALFELKCELKVVRKCCSACFGTPLEPRFAKKTQLHHHTQATQLLRFLLQQNTAWRLVGGGAGKSGPYQELAV
jgi:hypothetical protein